jgi:hypothetical protein
MSAAGFELANPASERPPGPAWNGSTTPASLTLSTSKISRYESRRKPTGNTADKQICSQDFENG